MRALDVNDKLLFLEAGLNEMKLDAQIKLTAKLERNLAKCVQPHKYGDSQAYLIIYTHGSVCTTFLSQVPPRRRGCACGGGAAHEGGR